MLENSERMVAATQTRFEYGSSRRLAWVLLLLSLFTWLGLPKNIRAIYQAATETECETGKAEERDDSEAVLVHQSSFLAAHQFRIPSDFESTGLLAIDMVPLGFSPRSPPL